MLEPDPASRQSVIEQPEMVPQLASHIHPRREQSRIATRLTRQPHPGPQPEHPITRTPCIELAQHMQIGRVERGPSRPQRTSRSKQFVIRRQLDLATSRPQTAIPKLQRIEHTIDTRPD